MEFFLGADVEQTALQSAQKELAKITESLLSISKIVQERIQSEIARDIDRIRPLPQLVVSPKIFIHDSPPPYPVTDEEFETLTLKRLSMVRQNPILFMIVAEILTTREKFTLFYGSVGSDSQELKPAKVLAAIQRIIDQPQSFLWLRLAWSIGPRQMQTFHEMYENNDDDTSDPDWWKHGRKTR